MTAAGAVVGAAITLLALGTQPAGAAQPGLKVTPRVAYTCTYTQQDGLWYAGYSTTTTELLVVDNWGSEVAELQCLLQHAGFSPGGIDGNFGPLTERALIKAQKARHLDIDGEGGPKTWVDRRRSEVGVVEMLLDEQLDPHQQLPAAGLGGHRVVGADPGRQSHDGQLQGNPAELFFLTLAHLAVRQGPEAMLVR